jgi:hypothetical protein
MRPIIYWQGSLSKVSASVRAFYCCLTAFCFSFIHTHTLSLSLCLFLSFLSRSCLYNTCIHIVGYFCASSLHSSHNVIFCCFFPSRDRPCFATIILSGSVPHSGLALIVFGLFLISHIDSVNYHHSSRVLFFCRLILTFLHHTVL